MDKAITQAEALIDFRNENLDRARGEVLRGSHEYGGGDCGKGDKQQPYPKKHHTYMYEGKKFVRHGDTKKKT